MAVWVYLDKFLLIFVIYIRFAQPKIAIMACVTVLYVKGHVSLLSNAFQIKTAVVHLESWWSSLKEWLIT